MVEGFSHDPSLGSRAAFSGCLVHGGFDGFGRYRASRGRTLTEDILACFHVQNCGLSVMTGIEHWNALVNGLLDDLVGVSGNLFWSWE